MQRPQPHHLEPVERAGRGRGGGHALSWRRCEPALTYASHTLSHTDPYVKLDFAHTNRYVKAMPEATSARAGGKRETREALILAGIAELAEKGLDEPSLDAICARAGFTRGAFYVHFEDRDDFIAAVMERVLGGLLDAIIATGSREHDLAQTVTRFT